jgi:hypothetical protein
MNSNQAPTQDAALQAQVPGFCQSVATMAPQIKKTIAARAMPLHGLKTCALLTRQSSQEKTNEPADSSGS